MGVLTCEYKMKSIRSIASRKPSQIHAAVRRILVESFEFSVCWEWVVDEDTDMCKSYHEGICVDRVWRHVLSTGPMTRVMGIYERMHGLLWQVMTLFTLDLWRKNIN